MNTLRTLIITIPAVRNISRNGEVINLDDHSVYLIDTKHHLKTRNWERHHSIRALPKGSKCVLVNYNTGDQVSAEMSDSNASSLNQFFKMNKVPSGRRPHAIG